MRITRTVRRHTVRVLLLAGIAAILMGCSAVPNLDQGGMGLSERRRRLPARRVSDRSRTAARRVEIVGRSAADVGRDAEAKGLIRAISPQLCDDERRWWLRRVLVHATERGTGPRSLLGLEWPAVRRRGRPDEARRPRSTHVRLGLQRPLWLAPAPSASHKGPGNQGPHEMKCPAAPSMAIHPMCGPALAS